MKIKAGAVSYLNTKPLIYGFNKGLMRDELEMVEDFPAAIASKLLTDEVDLGLVPVAVIPRLEESHIVTDYCIGCDGEVGSVCLFSDVPLEEVTEVLLDYQSRTSVQLARILLQDHWKVRPLLTNARADFRSQIGGTVAGLVIGDRAFEQRAVSKYVYDLGLGWKEMTGLPFVFATWVSNKKLPHEFCARFNQATGLGLHHIEEVVRQNPYELFDLNAYYTQYIQYRLDDEKRKALELFLKHLSLAPLS